MKYFVVKAPALACFLWLAVPCSSGQSSLPVRDQATNKETAAETEVRKRNADEVHAFLQGDESAMARVWSDDMVVTNPLNRFVTKQQVLGMVKSGFLVITAYERRIEYVRVERDTVIVAGSEAVTWGGKMPNAGKAETLRLTAIWMKQRGRWQEVARHANVVPQS